MTATINQLYRWFHFTATEDHLRHRKCIHIRLGFLCWHGIPIFMCPQVWALRNGEIDIRLEDDPDLCLIHLAIVCTFFLLLSSNKLLAKNPEFSPSCCAEFHARSHAGETKQPCQTSTGVKTESSYQKRGLCIWNRWQLRGSGGTDLGSFKMLPHYVDQTQGKHSISLSHLANSAPERLCDVSILLWTRHSLQFDRKRKLIGGWECNNSKADWAFPTYTSALLQKSPPRNQGAHYVYRSTYQGRHN